MVAESMVVDACEVYTGPAGTLPDGNEFKRCTTDDMETQCNIPSFVWSGRSSNPTPVAHFHAWTRTQDYYEDTTVRVNLRKQDAIRQFQTISAEMAAAILAVNSSFASDPLRAELFSAEGDAIHQLMDCMFMGPYARLDYGPRGHLGSLPTQSWSRSDTEDEVSLLPDG